MFSARKQIILLSALCLAGCEVARNSPPETLNPTPLREDEAMARRNFGPTTLAYTNTSTEHWSTVYLLRAPYNTPDPARLVIDPVLLVGQSITAPFVFVGSFGKLYSSRGETVGPTFHASPPQGVDIPYRGTMVAEGEEPIPTTQPIERPTSIEREDRPINYPTPR